MPVASVHVAKQLAEASCYAADAANQHVVCYPRGMGDCGANSPAHQLCHASFDVLQCWRTGSIYMLLAEHAFVYKINLSKTVDAP